MIAEETKSPSEKRVVIKEQEKRTRGPVKVSIYHSLESS